MSKRHAKIAVLLFACCSLLGAGCVEGQVRTFVKFEPQNDSFRYMEVYTNLHAKEKKDVDHLQSLWERRQSILINPVALQIFSRMALERKGKNKFCAINLGGPSAKAPEVNDTRVDLDTIKVIPGEFYLNAHHNLSYYHQIMVPGPTVDAIIEEATPSLANLVVELAQHQIQLAGNVNARRLTWDGLRKEILQKLREKDGPKADPRQDAQGEAVMPLEMASLQLLSKAATDKSVKLSRKRDVFTLIVPLSKTDCQEAIATVQLIRDTVAERIKAGKPVEKGISEALASFKIGYAPGTGLEVSADITQLARAGKVDVDPQPDAKKQLGYQKTIAAIQERGIEINKTFSIKQLVAEYVGK